ncbi:MAG: hypothetical protein ACTSYF_05105 [Promethearchaeota archaeon]
MIKDPSSPDPIFFDEQRDDDFKVQHGCSWTSIFLTHDRYHKCAEGESFIDEFGGFRISVPVNFRRIKND